MVTDLEIRASIFLFAQEVQRNCNYPEEEKAQLLIWSEAGNQEIRNQLSVLAVIVNYPLASLLPLAVSINFTLHRPSH